MLRALGADVDAQAEVEQTPEDVEAEEAAADVMLEADAEAEGDAADDDVDEDDESDEDEDEDEEPEAETPGTGTSRRLPLRRRRKGSEGAEPPAAPAPARQRFRREPGAPIPVVRAQAKYVRSSARKARLVCDHIRGKMLRRRGLSWLLRRVHREDWSKLLESAVANAEHNHELVGEDLYVKAVHDAGGSTIKRCRRARWAARRDPQTHQPPDDLAHAKGIITTMGQP